MDNLKFADAFPELNEIQRKVLVSWLIHNLKLDKVTANRAKRLIAK